MSWFTTEVSERVSYYFTGLAGTVLPSTGGPNVIICPTPYLCIAFIVRRGVAGWRRVRPDEVVTLGLVVRTWVLDLLGMSRV